MCDGSISPHVWNNEAIKTQRPHLCLKFNRHAPLRLLNCSETTVNTQQNQPIWKWSWIKPGSCWRHQMETFSALLAICAWNSPVTDEFPAQRPVTRSFDVFFDLRLYKRLSKQSWCWWFERPSRQLWRHCNDNKINCVAIGALPDH